MLILPDQKERAAAAPPSNLREPRVVWRGRADAVHFPNGLRGLNLPSGEERLRREAAEAETECDRLLRELDEIRVAHGLLARRAVSLEVDAGVLSATNAALMTRLRAIERSTTWRLTKPLRAAAVRFPRLVETARRAGRVLRWVVTLQVASRLRERRERQLATLVRPDSVLAPPIATSVAPHEIALPDPAHPLVSIIIPTFGKVDHTLRCLASIAASLTKASYEVIVIDDASHDIAVDMLAQVKNLRLIVSEVNRGFLRTCNEAARHAKGEFLLLLNNDTQVLPDFLDSMLEIFRDRPDTGVVGSKLIYPDGRLQEAGGIIWDDASGMNFGRLDDPDLPAYNYVREVDYCSGASLLLRRAVFEQLGGFDERYAPAYYEDTDLAFQLRERGLAVIYQPRSCVIHFEGVSHGRDVTRGVKAFQAQNQIRFRDRWRATLETDHFKPGPVTIPARDRTGGKPVVLIIDHFVPQPDRDAGSRNMLSFIRAMQQSGMTVKFWPQDQAYRPHYTAALQQMGVEVFYGPGADLFRRWITEHGAEISTVFLSRPTVASNYLADVKRHTDAKLVYYGHDLHFLRMRRQAEIQGSATVAREAGEMERMERWIWRSVDVVLHPSAEEAATVATMEPGVASRAVVPFSFRAFGTARPPVPGKAILFVAGFAHPPNEDAAVWFVSEVLPLIRARVPQARLDIVGSNPTRRVLDLAGEDVVVTPDVSDAALARFYAGARVAVVPLRFGAGMKLKVVEALKEGVPLVTTPAGAQGLPGLEDIVPVSLDPDAMADAVIGLLTDDAAWSRVAAAEIEFARARFSEEAVRKSLLEGFGE